MTGNEIVTLAIAGASLIVAIVSGRIAWVATETSRKQLALVQRKIGMVSDPARMTEILPVWYIDRMANDVWGFGLLIASGDILGVETINGVSDDGQWMEVTLLAAPAEPESMNGVAITYAPVEDRRKASVRVDQVQAAFELWTS
ncbi:hypothetical protein [Sphingomonas sp. PAMC 26617]|uniref:hypothetical protein n=1 Tax=Sphingomonas sp. PAMC 26617 TaxID=1112216 RepID=UPI000287CD85|nr:hypothetical protein [Sphingomonas sp. PAMC 26617]